MDTKLQKKFQEDASLEQKQKGWNYFREADFGRKDVVYLKEEIKKSEDLMANDTQELVKLSEKHSTSKQDLKYEGRMALEAEIKQCKENIAGTKEILVAYKKVLEQKQKSIGEMESMAKRCFQAADHALVFVVELKEKTEKK